MDLARQYERQFSWRAYEPLLSRLPPLVGAHVLDLGCGGGDVSALLVARGARVTGYDANQELLAAARACALAQAEFHRADLRALPEDTDAADGLWCSFVPAYFCALEEVLPRWLGRLRPGGWIALVEVDDLFGHAPLSAATRATLEAYAEEARSTGRYDFHMGGKLRAHLERAGCVVLEEQTLPDAEFAAHGPCTAEVVASWRARFERMPLLRGAAGLGHAELVADFLGCLQHPEHRAAARVVACLARRPT